MIHSPDLLELRPLAAEAPAELSTALWQRSGSGRPGTEAGTLLIDAERVLDRTKELRAAGCFRVAIHRRLESLYRLQPGWDSYGSPQISVEAIKLALQFLHSLGERKPLGIVPTSRGGIQLEWHRDGIHVEIECFPDGRASLFAEDESTDKAVERWVVPGHPTVDAWVRRVTRAG